MKSMLASMGVPLQQRLDLEKRASVATWVASGLRRFPMEPISDWFKNHSSDFANLVIAAFTVMLCVVAWRQNKLTQISQRAYLSVEPLGVALMVGGDRVLGHVGIYNAGNLPAQHVAWFLNIKSSLDRAERDFPIGDVSGDVVAIPRTLCLEERPKGLSFRNFSIYPTPFSVGIALRNARSTYMFGD